MSCAFVKTDGSACDAVKQRDSAFCLFHDETKAAVMAAARSRGGKQRHADDLDNVVAEAQTGPKAILAIVKRTIRKVRKCELSTQQGSTIAALCGVALKAIAAADTGERLNELEGKVSRLAQKLTPEQALEIVKEATANGVAARAEGH